MKTSQRTLFGKCSSRYRMKLQNRRIFIPTRDASVLVNGLVLHKTDVFASVPWFEIECSRSQRSTEKSNEKPYGKLLLDFLTVHSSDVEWICDGRNSVVAIAQLAFSNRQSADFRFIAHTITVIIIVSLRACVVSQFR